MNKSLSRSIGFWLLLIVSLVATAIGGWLIAGQIGTMTTTLLDGTATGVEVYVGQSLVVVGAGVLAAGIVGILLSLGLVAARSLVPVAAPAVVEPIDWSSSAEEAPAAAVETDAFAPSAAQADASASTEGTTVTEASAEETPSDADAAPTTPPVTR